MDVSGVCPTITSDIVHSFDISLNPARKIIYEDNLNLKDISIVMEPLNFFTTLPYVKDYYYIPFNDTIANTLFSLYIETIYKENYLDEYNKIESNNKFEEIQNTTINNFVLCLQRYLKYLNEKYEITIHELDQEYIKCLLMLKSKILESTKKKIILEMVRFNEIESESITDESFDFERANHILLTSDEEFDVVKENYKFSTSSRHKYTIRSGPLNTDDEALQRFNRKRLNNSRPNHGSFSRSSRNRASRGKPYNFSSSSQHHNNYRRREDSPCPNQTSTFLRRRKFPTGQKDLSKLPNYNYSNHDVRGMKYDDNSGSSNISSNNNKSRRGMGCGKKILNNKNNNRMIYSSDSDTRENLGDVVRLDDTIDEVVRANRAKLEIDGPHNVLNNDLKGKKRKKKRSSKIFDSDDSQDENLQNSNIPVDSCQDSTVFIEGGTNNGNNNIDEANEPNELNSLEKSKNSRRNIRKIKELSQLTEETRQAFKDEQARLKRIADNRDDKMKSIMELEEKRNQYIQQQQQELPKEIFLEMKNKGSSGVDNLGQEYLEKPNWSSPDRGIDLKIDSGIVQFLKPHQTKGVTFMYENIIESWKRFDYGKDGGNGCILAHLMGLGKTLQVITLLHTVMTNPHFESYIRTCLIICPQNVCLNWMAEIGKWMQYVEIPLKYRGLFHAKDRPSRRSFLRNWQEEGGLMIVGYDLFRKLSTVNSRHPKFKKAVLETFLNPGPDILVCDEGHLLKNSNSAICQAVAKIRTRRRIVLTGTPLQNNLYEYYCMVQLVRPNILGSKIEFQNMFANPIKNGQCADSTEEDVKVMKQRAHILHKKLSGFVQRMDYSIFKKDESRTEGINDLTGLEGGASLTYVSDSVDQNLIMNPLSTKYEYVIYVRLTPKQIELYKLYLDKMTSGLAKNNGTSEQTGDSCKVISDENSAASAVAAFTKNDNQEKPSNVAEATIQSQNYLSLLETLEKMSSALRLNADDVSSFLEGNDAIYPSNISRDLEGRPGGEHCHVTDLHGGDGLLTKAMTNPTKSPTVMASNNNKFSILIYYQELYNILTHPWLCPMRSYKRELAKKAKVNFLLSDDDAMSLDKYILDDPLEEDVVSISSTTTPSLSSNSNELSHTSNSNHAYTVKRKSKSGHDEELTFEQLCQSPRMITRRAKLLSLENGGNMEVRDVIPSDKQDENMILNKITEDLLNEKDTPLWWTDHISSKDTYDIFLSGKIILLLEILKEAEAIGDKVLLFTQSLLTLDYIENILAIVDNLLNPSNSSSSFQEENTGQKISGSKHSGTKRGSSGNNNNNNRMATMPPWAKLSVQDISKLELHVKRFLCQGWTYPTWIKGLDYFRMDGSTSINSRFESTQTFNEPGNLRARFYIVSTKAGSLGVNLTGASRIIIMDACWNPTHDTQSIFRAYRLGQTKPVFIYRFISQGTIEERIYERQVTKQSLSQRVVDKKQVERHYTFDTLRELYTFDPDPYDSQEENDDALNALIPDFSDSTHLLYPSQSPSRQTIDETIYGGGEGQDPFSENNTASFYISSNSTEQLQQNLDFLPFQSSGNNKIAIENGILSSHQYDCDGGMGGSDPLFLSYRDDEKCTVLAECILPPDDFPPPPTLTTRDPNLVVNTIQGFDPSSTADDQINETSSLSRDLNAEKVPELIDDMDIPNQASFSTTTATNNLLNEAMALSGIINDLDDDEHDDDHHHNVEQDEDTEEGDYCSAQSEVTEVTYVSNVINHDPVYYAPAPATTPQQDNLHHDPTNQTNNDGEGGDSINNIYREPKLEPIDYSINNNEDGEGIGFGVGGLCDYIPEYVYLQSAEIEECDQGNFLEELLLPTTADTETVSIVTPVETSIKDTGIFFNHLQNEEDDDNRVIRFNQNLIELIGCGADFVGTNCRPILPHDDNNNNNNYQAFTADNEYQEVNNVPQGAAILNSPPPPQLLSSNTNSNHKNNDKIRQHVKKYPIPPVPKDHLLAQLLLDHKRWIVTYSDHDSLLENKLGEELTEEERKAAWDEYEAERVRVKVITTISFSLENNTTSSITTTITPTSTTFSASNTLAFPLYNSKLGLLSSHYSATGAGDNNRSYTVNHAFNGSVMSTNTIPNSTCRERSETDNMTNPFDLTQSILRHRRSPNNDKLTKQKRQSLPFNYSLPQSGPDVIDLLSEDENNFYTGCHGDSNSLLLQSSASSTFTMPPLLTALSSNEPPPPPLPPPPLKRKRRPAFFRQTSNIYDLSRPPPNAIVSEKTFIPDIQPRESFISVPQKIIFNSDIMNFLYNPQGHVDFNNLVPFMKSKESTDLSPTNDLLFKKKIVKMAQFLECNRSKLLKMIHESRDKYIELTITIPQSASLSHSYNHAPQYTLPLLPWYSPNPSSTNTPFLYAANTTTPHILTSPSTRVPAAMHLTNLTHVTNNYGTSACSPSYRTTFLPPPSSQYVPNLFSNTTTTTHVPNYCHTNTFNPYTSIQPWLQPTTTPPFLNFTNTHHTAMPMQQHQLPQQQLPFANCSYDNINDFYNHPYQNPSFPLPGGNNVQQQQYSQYFTLQNSAPPPPPPPSSKRGFRVINGDVFPFEAFK